MEPGADDFSALGVLAEPQRARIYAQLAAATQPQTRQEVCEALGLGRTLVAFHLDKLQRAGLVHAVRPEAAPGARGRPPQRYAATDREVIATVPPRRYELLAQVLLRATREQAPGEPIHAAAVRAARARGVELAQGLEPAGEDHSGTAEDARPWEALTRLLSRIGYQPRRDGDALILTNCPFQRLRVTDTELVCSINAALSAGYLDGLAMNEAVTPRLRPCPVNCCIVLEPAA
ncbi:Predicted transcriptional regulator, ArsR family [Lentzea xinjiangensis]|uniref:Predicted transcriptional regulator, ArsR family n=1 Tax=Lentzea xinjiangensis TaxID=402600 RepID=A0A1H9TUL8_9PSEU|nr:helix-turn-helix domain-containing protein [Lentzea xinjiangensis]SES00935.1 Predicted transcriptional regulator, ArsR family [Lentzea xinjiangensis]